MKRLAFLSLFVLTIGAAGQTSSSPSVSHVPSRADVISLAGPRELLDLPKLTTESDLVVVADITKLQDVDSYYVRDGSTNAAKDYSAVLNIREVLKGDVSPGPLTVHGVLPLTGLTFKTGALQPNTTRIFLLKNDRGGWTFVDPFYGALIAAPVVPRPVEGTVVENVRLQMLSAMKSDLVSAPEKRALITQLRSMNDPEVVGAFRSELSKTHDEALTCALLAELISRKDNDALGEARKLIAASNSKYVGGLLEKMASLNRPDLLPEIAAGAKSGNSMVRMSAISALATSSLPEANRELLGLLDSTDRHLVTQVMISLAGKYGKPDWAPYMDDDAHWDEMRQQWREFRDSSEARK